MDAYHVVLYVHLIALFVGIGAGAVLVACLFGLRASRTLADAVPWGMLAGRTARLFPIAIVGLFGTGAYMTTHLWTWGTSWIDVSIAGLVLLSVQGPLLGERSAKQLERALHENGPGPLGEAARRATRSAGLWVGEFSNLGLVLGIVWNMTEKPGVGEGVAALVIGYAAGAALALRLSRAARPELEVVSEPAA